MRYTQKQIDNLLDNIYFGVISIENLPKDLYAAISSYLISGLDVIKEDSSIDLLIALTKNLEYFSGAKVYSQINDISLLKDSNTIKSFSDFKTEALQIYNQYNVNWLETEYNTTIQQAQNCVRWEQIQQQKKTLPFLQYSAVVDVHTDEICLALNDVTMPVDDPFWDSNAPTNHFNCRCVLIQLDEFDSEQTPNETIDTLTPILENRQPLFNDNVGKSQMIFNEAHPYFENYADE
jgi:SPP1 gp7 family putative phage head morphogenesis protein